MAESWYITLDESADGAGDGTTFGNLDANDLSPDWQIGSWSPIQDPVGTNRGQAFDWSFIVYFSYTNETDVVTRWNTLLQSLIGTHDFRIYDENDNLQFSFTRTEYVNGVQVSNVVPRNASGNWKGWLSATITITARKGNAAIATHRGALFVRTQTEKKSDDFKEITNFSIVAQGDFTDCRALVIERLNVLPGSFEKTIREEPEEGRVTGSAVEISASGGGGGGQAWVTRLSISHDWGIAPKIPIELTAGKKPIIRDGMIRADVITVVLERESKTGEFKPVDFGIIGLNARNETPTKEGDTWKKTDTANYLNTTGVDAIAKINEILNQL